MAIYGNALMTGIGQGGGGGEILPTDAILRVQAPAGSTVTISKGATTKTDMGHENADDPAIYDYYFIIHQSQFDSINSWTVTVTDGTDTATNTVIIDSADEYNLSMVLKYWFVRDGVLKTLMPVAIGMKTTSSSGATATPPRVIQETGYLETGFYDNSPVGTGIVYFPNKVDLSKYTTLRIVGTAKNDTATPANNAIMGWSEIGEYQNTNRLFSQNTLTSVSSSFVSINLSILISQYGNAYIGANHGAVANNAYTVLRIVDMWLE